MMQVDTFEASDLLRDATATLEFGAGQGALTHLVRKHIAEESYDHDSPVVSVLVDRDNKLPTWTGTRACWSESADVHSPPTIRYIMEMPITHLEMIPYLINMCFHILNNQYYFINISFYIVSH